MIVSARLRLDEIQKQILFRNSQSTFVCFIYIGTGMRVGVCTRLRWENIDLEAGIIDINHTLGYYCNNTGRNEKGNKCYFGINTPKTKSGSRQIPMQDYVKDAFIREWE